MILSLSNEVDRQKFRTYCDFLFNKEAAVEIKEIKMQRSLAQNRYLHLCLAYFASEFGYDLEQVKYDLFKKTVNKEIFERERAVDGELRTYYRSTSDLDTGEMTTAIERWRDWSVREAGLYIPEANEHEAILEAEKQIALCEKYL